MPSCAAAILRYEQTNHTQVLFCRRSSYTLGKWGRGEGYSVGCNLQPHRCYILILEQCSSMESKAKATKHTWFALVWATASEWSETSPNVFSTKCCHQWHQGRAGEEILSFITQVYCNSLLPFPFIIWIGGIDRIDWPRLFTPMLSDYWAELHWAAIPSQRAMSQLLSFSPPRRLQHWAADAVAYRTAAPSNTRFSAPRLFFVFSPSFYCPAYHLSPFLSKDIHQRNMAPPSPVTPSALCQLSEPESTDCCSCWRRWGGCWQPTTRLHTFVSIKTPLLPELPHWIFNMQSECLVSSH